MNNYTLEELEFGPITYLGTDNWWHVYPGWGQFSSKEEAEAAYWYHRVIKEGKLYPTRDAMGATE